MALYNDIYYKKPAFDLKEGVFFTYIPNYAIKAGKKEADGKTLRNVLIYEQTNPLQNNCIIAEKAVMQISDDQKFLEFNLQNGYRYQENGNNNDTATEYIRLGFTSFKKLFDLSSFQKQNTNDSIYKNNFKMLSARQISYSLDSLYRMNDSLSARMNRSLNIYLHYTHVSDSVWKKTAFILPKYNRFDSLVPDSLRIPVNDAAVVIANNVRGSIENAANEIETRRNDILYHKIEWHRKFSLSMACFVLFFIGAPLGSIIRKGGLGMPLVVAIIFFLIFHLLNMFGEKFVKEGMISPFIGMWLAVLVLTPVGIFLTYKAMHDSQLFSKEFYYRSFKKVQGLFGIFKGESPT